MKTCDLDYSSFESTFMVKLISSSSLTKDEVISYKKLFDILEVIRKCNFKSLSNASCGFTLTSTN